MAELSVYGGLENSVSRPLRYMIFLIIDTPPTSIYVIYKPCISRYGVLMVYLNSLAPANYKKAFTAHNAYTIVLYMCRFTQGDSTPEKTNGDMCKHSINQSIEWPPKTSNRDK